MHQYFSSSDTCVMPRRTATGGTSRRKSPVSLRSGTESLSIIKSRVPRTRCKANRASMGSCSLRICFTCYRTLKGSCRLPPVPDTPQLDPLVLGPAPFDHCRMRERCSVRREVFEAPRCSVWPSR